MSEVLTTLPWSPGLSVVVFGVAGGLTVVGSIRLVTLGDALADRTGWGEALFGAVFFGLTTSLSGIVMTVVTAAGDQPQLGYGNAVGGIAAQTTAVAVADAFLRRVNLEHAVASLSNVLFGALLIVLLALALLGSYAPDVTLGGVHPISLAIVGAYLGGLHLIRRSGASPLWQAVATTETLPDVPHDHGRLDRSSSTALWGRFAAVGLVVSAGGWAIARAAESLVVVTGLSTGFIGAILMGAVNALPETVTAVAAVRRGAPTLAIAAVLGGNSLDALNLVVGDLAYRSGSIYHAAGPAQLFVTTSALFMTAILLGGLLVRQACGWGRLGFEGILLLASYAAMTLVLAV
ncbi:cation transporter [Micromonospora sp. WMMA1363]|uniref:sodium:calcium antiporter n=1 Tax=Micromonospora sp. WMMA1363 TaxID=3053985 RepID=UPI00259CE971|nr:cation transporter [Micromonospora sp. WMMA1363]MDM4722287.1 cation transporter [Micromonospora sp. WMMA1363]